MRRRLAGADLPLYTTHIEASVDRWEEGETPSTSAAVPFPSRDPPHGIIHQSREKEREGCPSSAASCVHGFGSRLPRNRYVSLFFNRERGSLPRRIDLVAVEGEGDEKALKMVSLNWCISVGLFGCCFVHSVLYLHVLGYVFFCRCLVVCFACR